MKRYIPEKEAPGSDFIALLEENFKRLSEIDKEAKAKGEILGRYIAEPFADGKAFYQITKVNKRTVVIEHCTGFGDDWQIPYWGKKATIDRSYAEQEVSRRDRVAEIFRRG